MQMRIDFRIKLTSGNGIQILMKFVYKFMYFFELKRTGLPSMMRFRFYDTRGFSSLVGFYLSNNTIYYIRQSHFHYINRNPIGKSTLKIKLHDRTAVDAMSRSTCKFHLVRPSPGEPFNLCRYIRESNPELRESRWPLLDGSRGGREVNWFFGRRKNP